MYRQGKDMVKIVKIAVTVGGIRLHANLVHYLWGSE